MLLVHLATSRRLWEQGSRKHYPGWTIPRPARRPRRGGIGVTGVRHPSSLQDPVLPRVVPVLYDMRHPSPRSRWDHGPSECRGLNTPPEGRVVQDPAWGPGASAEASPEYLGDRGPVTRGLVIFPSEERGEER